MSSCDWSIMGGMSAYVVMTSSLDEVMGGMYIVMMSSVDWSMMGGVSV